MSEIYAPIGEVNPRFALYNLVFSASRADEVTVGWASEELAAAGLGMPAGEIGESFEEWEGRGMLHSEDGVHFKVGCC